MWLNSAWRRNLEAYRKGWEQVYKNIFCSVHSLIRTCQSNTMAHLLPMTMVHSTGYPYLTYGQLNLNWFLRLILPFWFLCSVVNIETRRKAWVSGVRFQAETLNIFLLRSMQASSELTQLPVQWVLWIKPGGLMVDGRLKSRSRGTNRVHLDPKNRPFVQRQLVPSVISRGTPCQTSETSVSEGRK
jgi:hypothetical protein